MGPYIPRIKNSIRALLLVWLIAILFWPSLASANPFAELPASHWSYSVMEMLEAKGLLGTGQIGGSSEGQTITRYEMAMSVARVLGNLEKQAAAGSEQDSVNSPSANSLGAKLYRSDARAIDLNGLIAGYNARKAPNEQLTRTEQQMIEQLTTEFRSELEVLGFRITGTSREQDVATLSAVIPLGNVQSGGPVSGSGRLEDVILTPVIADSESDIFLSVEGFDPFDGRNLSELEFPALIDPDKNSRFKLSTGLGKGGTLDIDWKKADDETGFAMKEPEEMVLSFEGLYIDIPNKFVARVGELPELELGGFSVYHSGSLEGLQAGIELGRIGSTLVFAQHNNDGGETDDYITALDGTVYLTDKVILAASYAQQAPNEAAQPGTTVTSLGGTFKLSPKLSLLGQYYQSNQSSGLGRAFELGATWKVGEVEVGANYKRSESGFQPLISDQRLAGSGLSGYGLSFKLGDVFVTTERSSVRESEPYPSGTNEGTKRVTSVGLNYEVPSVGALRAGYEYVDLDQLVESTETEGITKASFGVDVYIPRGTVKAGVTYELDPNHSSENSYGAVTTSAGVEYQLPANNKLTADIALRTEEMNSKKTTSIGLGYSIGNEAWVLLGYELVDFTQVPEGSGDSSTNMTTAEFAIRF